MPIERGIRRKRRKHQHGNRAFQKRRFNSAKVVLDPVHRVKGIQFGLCRPDELTRLSVVQLHESLAHRSTDPTPASSVIDAQMGPPTTANVPCGHCGRTTNCPGHEGTIQLPFPIYSSLFLRKVCRILSCVCFWCSRCTIPRNDPAIRSIDIRLPPTGNSRIRTYRHQELVAFATKKSTVKATIEPAGDGAGSGNPQNTKKRKARTVPCGKRCPFCQLPQPEYMYSKKSQKLMSISATFRPYDIRHAADGYMTQQMTTPFTSSRAHSILRQIPEKDLKYLCVAKHPEAMVPSIITVLPTPMRPTVIRRATGRRETHDISGRYAMISKYADQLYTWAAKVHAGNRTHDVVRRVTVHAASALACLAPMTHTLPSAMHDALRQHPQMMQLHEKIQSLYSQIVDNTGTVCPRESNVRGVPYASLANALPGKTGIIRQFATAKRTRYSSRSVIGGTPYIAPTQVGVPKSMALRSTVPERVTSWNIDRLREAVIRGPDKLPGALVVQPAEGAIIDLRIHGETRAERVRWAQALEIGSIVDRHLGNGDHVLMNRAPTLDKRGIMGHRVVIVPGNTLLLNPIVTPAYNADFDGDAMSMHVLQTPEGQAEASQLGNVVENLISEGTNAPCMGLVQDSLLGAFAMTRRDTLFTHDQMLSILSPVIMVTTRDMGMDEVDGMYDVDVPRLSKPPEATVRVRNPRTGRWEKYYSGATLVSSVMKLYNVSYQRNVLSISTVFEGDTVDQPGGDQNQTVLIHHGELLVGRLDKGIVGAGANLSAIHTVSLYRSRADAVRMLQELQLVIQKWVDAEGMSLQLADMAVGPNIVREISCDAGAMHHAITRLQRLGREMGIAEDVVEGVVNSVIQAADQGMTKRVMHALQERVGSTPNTLLQIVRSGAKASDANVRQMAGVAGQQRISGERLHNRIRNNCCPSIAHRRRITSYYGEDDLSAISRGYVLSSYSTGVRPAEIVSGAAVARKAVVQKTNVVADVGYTNRKSSNHQDGIITMGQSARWGTQVIQHRYGGDGFNSNMLQRVDLKLPLTTPLVEWCVWRDVYGHCLSPSPRAFLHLRRWQDESIRTLYGICFPLGNTVISAPFHVPTLMRLADDQVFRSAPTRCPIDDIVAMIERIETTVSQYIGPSTVALLAMHIAWSLFHVSRALTQRLLEFIETTAVSMVMRALVPNGEATGLQSALSLGRPMMQMMLDATHASGRGSSSGITQIRELYKGELADNIAMPLTYIRCAPDAIRRIRKRLTSVQFQKVVGSVSVIHLEEESPAQQWALELMRRCDPSLDAPLSMNSNMSMNSNTQRTMGTEAHDEAPLSPEYIASPFALLFKLDDEVCSVSDVTPESIVRVLHDNVAKLFKDALSMYSRRSNKKSVKKVATWRISANGRSTTVQQSYYEGNGECKDCQKGGIAFRREKHYGMVTYHSTPLDDVWYVLVRPYSKCSSYVSMLFAQNLKNTILWNITIGDVSGVERVDVEDFTFAEYDETTQCMVQHTTPRLVAHGVCLRRASILEGVDWYKTLSNNVMEVYDVLGIWAARTVMFQQLHAMFSARGYTDTRHIMMLVDTCFANGYFQSDSVGGVSGTAYGPLHKVSFEKPHQQFINAAVIGAVDNLDGPAQAVMVGERGVMGTGAVGVLPTQEVGTSVPASDAREQGHLVSQNVREEVQLEYSRARELLPPPDPHTTSSFPCAPAHSTVEYNQGLSSIGSAQTHPVNMSRFDASATIPSVTDIPFSAGDIVPYVPEPCISEP